MQVELLLDYMERLYQKLQVCFWYTVHERQSTFILQNQNSRDNQHLHDELFEV
jgi:hypothetical protein